MSNLKKNKIKRWIWICTVVVLHSMHTQNKLPVLIYKSVKYTEYYNLCPWSICSCWAAFHQNHYCPRWGGCWTNTLTGTTMRGGGGSGGKEPKCFISFFRWAKFILATQSSSCCPPLRTANGQTTSGDEPIGQSTSPSKKDYHQSPYRPLNPCK